MASGAHRLAAALPGRAWRAERGRNAQGRHHHDHYLTQAARYSGAQLAGVASREGSQECQHVLPEGWLGLLDGGVAGLIRALVRQLLSVRRGRATRRSARRRGRRTGRAPSGRGSGGVAWPPLDPAEVQHHRPAGSPGRASRGLVKVACKAIGFQGLRTGGVRGGGQRPGEARLGDGGPFTVTAAVNEAGSRAQK